MELNKGKMKKRFILFTMVLLFLTPNYGHSQSQEIQQLILNIEKLAQFKDILKDMKKGYEILRGGYKAVKDMSEGNFALHKTFLDGLMQVSPAVKNYKKVADIISAQLLMVKESRKAVKRFSGSNNYSLAEIKYFERIYARLTKESLRNLDDLSMILTADKLRMSDDERMAAIDKIYEQMQHKVTFVRSFNTSSSLLALQRMKEAGDVSTAKKLHSLKK